MRQLNYAESPFRNQRLPWFAYGIGVAVLAAISVIHGVTLTRYLLREQEALDVKVASLQTELNGLEVDLLRTQGELDTERDQARTEKILFLAALYRRRSFSWTGFFNELETLTPASVRITSIAPGGVGPIDADAEDELEVQIQIVARTLDDVLEMMRRLESNHLYASVLPLRESEGGQQVEGVAVTLTLNYLPQREKSEVEPEIAGDVPVEDEAVEDTPVDDMPGEASEEVPVLLPGEGNIEAPKPVSKGGENPPKKS